MQKHAKKSSKKAAAHSGHKAKSSHGAKPSKSHPKTASHKSSHEKKKTAAHHVQKHSPAVKHYAKKFCPQCGNIINDDNTLCTDCRTVDFDFKEIKILVCNSSKSYNHKNKWQNFTSLNSAIDHVVSESVKHKAKFVHLDEEKVEELLSFKAGVHKDITLTVAIGKDRFDLPASFDVTLCPKCAKQGTKYFEGILQARNVSDEIRKFIKSDIAKQKSKGIHINKEVIIEGDGLNIDYYYTDKRYLKTMAEKLRKNFGATIKQNAQLFSIDWETSKNLYRVNMLVYFPKYAKGDVLKVDNQLYLIVSMDEKIHVMNLEKKSKTLLAHKDTYEVLKPIEAIIIKKYPQFEILDPNTYYQARLMNPLDVLQVNQKIHVVIDGAEAWMTKE